MRIDKEYQYLKSLDERESVFGRFNKKDIKNEKDWRFYQSKLFRLC